MITKETIAKAKEVMERSKGNLLAVEKVVTDYFLSFNSTVLPQLTSARVVMGAGFHIKESGAEMELSMIMTEHVHPQLPPQQRKAAFANFKIKSLEAAELEKQIEEALQLQLVNPMSALMMTLTQIDLEQKARIVTPNKSIQL